MLNNQSMMNMAVVGIIGIIYAGVVGAAAPSQQTALVAEDADTFEVKRGPLKISVVEPGTIKARKQVIIKNEVEGRRSLLYLIPEGTRVKKGELLVELDASSLIDQKVEQEIRVQNVEASFIRARENLSVVENQAESNVDKAELTYTFAKQDLQKYIEGEYPNLLTEAESRINLSREELLRSEEKLEWSKRLYLENYLSQTELKQDELAVSRNKLNLEKTENDFNLLKDYTYKRKVDELQSNVTQAEMALERTQRKAKADIIQAQADFRAKQAEYNRQLDKLKKAEDMIAKAKIYAPADGLVVYASSAKGGHPHMRRMQQPLEEGQEIREQQELIHLPTSTSVKAEISIPETSLEKIKIKMPVRVTIEALPGEVFSGYIAKIALLPSPQMMWFAETGLNYYNADVYLENNGFELRTGMNCTVEIVIEQHSDVVYVPIQSVIRIKGVPTVYTKDGKYFKPRKIEIGLDNNKMVHVVSGLKPGEKVLLNPPLASGTVEDVLMDEFYQPDSSDDDPLKGHEKAPQRNIQEQQSSAHDSY